MAQVEQGQPQQAGAIPGLGSIPGIGSIPGVGSIPGLGGPPPSVGDIQSKGMSAVQGFFQNGIPVNWIGLFVLAGGIPVAPLSFLGYGGLNLMVVGAMMWAAAKAAVQGGCVLAQRYLKAYYPSLWWISAVLTYSPWYIFDIVQMFSPTFAQDGYKIPFTQKIIGGKGATGTMKPAQLAIAIGLTSAGAYTLLQYLPKEILDKGKPLLETLFKVVGAGSLLSGGGLSAYAALPEVLKSIRGNLAGPQAGGGAAPPPPTTAPAGAIPSLQKIADAMLGPEPYGGPAPVDWQRGGDGGADDGPSELSAKLFMLILAVVTLGGISLAVAGKKVAPAPSTETLTASR